MVFILLPVFQMLDTAQTSEPAVHHDGHPGAQGFTLFHTNRHGKTLKSKLEVNDTRAFLQSCFITVR